MTTNVQTDRSANTRSHTAAAVGNVRVAVLPVLVNGALKLVVCGQEPSDEHSAKRLHSKEFNAEELNAECFKAESRQLTRCKLDYDYQGLRVQKDGDDGLLKYTYDDDSVLVQSNNSGQTVAKYDYGPDQLLSLNHSTEGRQFYLFDALGSAVNLTTPGGTLQARYQYAAQFASLFVCVWQSDGVCGSGWPHCAVA